MYLPTVYSWQGFYLQHEGDGTIPCCQSRGPLLGAPFPGPVVTECPVGHRDMLCNVMMRGVRQNPLSASDPHHPCVLSAHAAVNRWTRDPSVRTNLMTWSLCVHYCPSLWCLTPGQGSRSATGTPYVQCTLATAITEAHSTHSCANLTKDQSNWPAGHWWFLITHA